MKQLEKFVGMLVGPELFARLDRNFSRVAQEQGPYAVSSAFTCRDNDQISSVQVNAASGPLTITLPAPTGNRRITIIKTDSSANVVTVSAAPYLINLATTLAFGMQFDNITVEPTGTGWIIIAGVGWEIVG